MQFLIEHIKTGHTDCSSEQTRRLDAQQITSPVVRLLAVASNARQLNDELERLRKEAVWSNLSYYPGLV
jgi:hypothetical protein